MKTKLLFLSMSIGMMSMANPKAEDLSLEGKFLSQKNIKCEVYRLSADSTIHIVSTCENRSGYSVKLTAGIQYVIKFISYDGKIVKYLFVDPKTPGRLTLDVNFRNDDSASLRYEGSSAQITDANPRSLIKVKR